MGGPNLSPRRSDAIAQQGVSDQAQRLIQRCARGDLIGTLPQTVWQELTHKLMLGEAMMRGLILGGNPAGRRSTKPGAIRGLSLYRAKVQALVDLGLRFEACALSDLTKTGLGCKRSTGC